MAASLDVTHQGNRFSGGWLGEYIGPDYLPAAGFLSRPDLIRNNPGGTLDLRPSWKPAFVRRFVFHSSANIYHRASDGRFEEAQWFVPLAGRLLQQQRLVPQLPGAELAAPRRAFRAAPRRARGARPLPVQPLPRSPPPPTRRAASSCAPTSRPGPSTTAAPRCSRSARWPRPTPRASLTLSYTLNALHDMGVARTDVTTHLLAPTLRLAFDPNLQLTLFYQRNTAAQLSTWNARLSWEFRPLSYVYVVYNERAPLTTTRPLRTGNVRRTDGPAADLQGHVQQAVVAASGRGGRGLSGAGGQAAVDLERALRHAGGRVVPAHALGAAPAEIGGERGVVAQPPERVGEGGRIARLDQQPAARVRDRSPGTRRAVAAPPAPRWPSPRAGRGPWARRTGWAR